MTGGFGVGSDSMTDILVSAGYSINEQTAVLVGYRHMWLDYTDGGFEFDARIHGLGLGLDYRF
ncbi:hypothetical protein CK507_10930 [Pseudomonas sp. WN033]|nr:hypothetical protein CK507_10930 [Pseudomonas sp. WN033]